MLMKSSKILTLAVAFAILASVMTPLLGVGPVANAAADDPKMKNLSRAMVAGTKSPIVNFAAIEYPLGISLSLSKSHFRWWP